ncbi:MAG: M23 family metallopeptidase [Alphaproteobacteria bacterium]|nr:M23 family metallopeptidase [Alphaproteobacteria bacterium]
MFSSARAIALLALIATAAAPVGPALGGWLDWGLGERSAARGEATRAESGQHQLTVAVERGDTLLKILAGAGVHSSESARVLDAMRDLVDPKRLQIGDSVVLTLGEAQGRPRLVALHVDFRPDMSLTLVRGQDGGFHAASVGGRSSLVVETVAGKVAKSFRPSLVQAGLPATLADEVIRALDYDPGLPKRIKTGTEFQVIYERFGATSGGKPGDRLRLRYAQVTLGGTPHRFYHYAPPGAAPKFFDEGGRPLDAIRFVTPIDGGKVNSPFGMRLHPVLRKMRLHRGVDFPAPKGTPVYAAADGVVEDLGWRGNYGNYMRIAHDARYATAYGHLDGFAPEVVEGTRVVQGQLIGYVGRTGLASGNHLYWEVLVDNKQVDPMKVRTVKAGGLEGPELQKFQRFVKETHAQAAALR